MIGLAGGRCAGAAAIDRIDLWQPFLALPIPADVEAKVLYVAAIVADEEQRNSDSIHTQKLSCDVSHSYVPTSFRI